MDKGKFIVIEGLDYSGKTTLAGLMVAHLRSLGIEVIHSSCSNKNNRLARVVKEHVLAVDNLPSADTQAMLYAACINDLVETELLPAINAGKWVVCERFTLSNKIYQAHSPVTTTLTGVIERQLSPDVTIVLDITPYVYMQRSNIREEGADAMERSDDHVVNQRRKQYRLHARQFDNIKLLDSTMPKEQLLEAAIKILRDTVL